MKVLLTICSSLCYIFSFAQSSSNLLIEDFEDGNNQNNLGGYWYSFNDNQNGGNSRLKQLNWQQESFVTMGGHDSKGMFNVDAVLDKGNYQWSPYVAIGTSVQKSTDVDPSQFAGISYWHKGVGHKLRVETPEVTDYDFYQIPVPASTDWKLVIIDFAMLNQGGWGKKVDFNKNNSLKFVWNLEEKSGNFQLDHVQLLSEIKYVKQNDMEVKPAEIPVSLKVKGNISSPLNNLAKKYLNKGMNLDSWGESNKVNSSNPKDWKYNETTIQQQAKQGLLGIRFPIDFDLYVEDRINVFNGSNKNIKIEPMLYTLLDSLNVWTKRHKLSLTIDYHAYDGTYSRVASKDPKFRQSAASLWGVIAKHFVKEKREDLFFELTNEPGLSLPDGEYIDQSDWTLLAQMMIDTIRKTDKTRPIIFGDTKWYSLDELIKNKPFKDKYVIYSFHMYDPFVFSHQGASWTNMGTMKNVPFPYSPQRWSTEFRDFGVIDGTPGWVKDQMKNYYKEGNKQFIKNRLVKVKNWAFDHQVPLICNEWGALSYTAKIEDLNVYFKTMGEVFSEMDIAWQVWFGVMDSDKKLLPGMAEALELKAK